MLVLDLAFLRELMIADIQSQDASPPSALRQAGAALPYSPSSIPSHHNKPAVHELSIAIWSQAAHCVGGHTGPRGHVLMLPTRLMLAGQPVRTTTTTTEEGGPEGGGGGGS